MMQERLYRAKSGVVFDDTFSNVQIGAEYLINDTAHVGITLDGLRLTHSNIRDIRVLRDIPDEAGAVEVFTTYTPVLEHDKAGFILFDTADTTAQLLEYKDDRLSDLTNIKVVRNGNVFDLFMKHDAFLHVDSVEHPFNKFGFITKRGQTDYEPMLIHRFLCTTSPNFIVRNLDEGFSVELATTDQVFSGIAGIDGRVSIPFDHLVQTGTLSIKDANGLVLSEISADFFAGDEWCFGSYLVLRKDGINLDTLTPTELGRISNNALEIQLELYNPSTATALDIELAVAKYNSLFGNEWADVAYDENGSAGGYSDALYYEELLPSGSKYFWVKLERTAAVTSQSVMNFCIELKHE